MISSARKQYPDFPI